MNTERFGAPSFRQSLMTLSLILLSGQVLMIEFSYPAFQRSITPMGLTPKVRILGFLLEASADYGVKSSEDIFGGRHPQRGKVRYA